MKAWLILWSHAVASWIDSYSDGRHLTTDPACARFEEPRQGSRLDRSSRGVSCTPCMVRRAFAADDDPYLLDGDCPACYGAGFHEVDTAAPGSGWFTNNVTCISCDGTGRAQSRDSEVE